jgi:hypothetical protein
MSPRLLAALLVLAAGASAPVPAIEDAYYPVEEAAQTQGADVPVVVRISPDASTVSLSCASHPTPEDFQPGAKGVFGAWDVLAILPATTSEAAAVVMERRFERWGLVVISAAAPTGEMARLRKPLGQLELLDTQTYNLTGPEPGYFTRAASDPLDYIGTRIVNESDYREASFLTAAKFLPPIADYVVIGDTRAPMKAVVTMNGKIKRADGPNEEPVVVAASGRGATGATVPEASTSSPTPCTHDSECATGRDLRGYCAALDASLAGSTDSATTTGVCQPGGTTVFSAESFLGLPLAQPYANMQTGVLGGYKRVASVGCYDSTQGTPQEASPRGFEMMAVGPLKADNDTILVALRKYNSPQYQYRQVSIAQRWGTAAANASRASSAAAFYAAVLEHSQEWDAFFGTPHLRSSASSPSGPATAARVVVAAAGQGRPMQPRIPSTERRQLDMARGVIVAASTVWIGNEPNYGTGGDYWLTGPPRAAMQDTSGVGDSLPLTSLALDYALLQFGLFDSALQKIGFYLDTFIFPNGTIDMGHWKDPWKDEGGGGQWNCTFPDGLTDHGRVVALYTDAVRYSQDLGFMQAHAAAVERIARYLLRARAEAVAKFPPGDPRHGMIYGPAEHDTCDMGMAPMGGGGKGAVEVVDGQYMLYYFSVSMWYWRGMVEVGRLLEDFPASFTNGTAGASAASQLAAKLLQEAGRFKIDIDAAVTRSVVHRSANNGGSSEGSGEGAGEGGREGGDEAAIVFVPSAVAPAGTTPTPYPTMTTDTVASYSNFRYYSEMLSAQFMDNVTARALMDFRETHGGSLSGMTRYTDHLDDMPAIGYARSSLSADRLDKFLLLLYGHAANYQGRGSFFTTEQQSLYQLQGSSRWRASLGEIQANFCTPSQMLVASMTALQFISEERDGPATVWLARGAPVRWFTDPGGFGVEAAPCRYGTVSFAVLGAQMTLNADFSFAATGMVSGRSGGNKTTTERGQLGAGGGVTIRLRLRDPSGKGRGLAAATATTGSECVVERVDSEADVVVLAAVVGLVKRCVVVGTFA